jgi:hypothetical protein
MSESRAAFGELLATLDDVGDRFAGADWGLTDAVDVAEGLRVVMHLLATGLETQFEDDAAHPVFRAIVTPWRKSLGDNADARYHDAPVHPAGTYRVRGRMAGAVYVSFTVEAGAEDGAFPSGTVGSLNDTGFDVGDDGSFETTLGGPARARGWLALPEDASRITVRHYWEDLRSPPSIGRVRRVQKPGAAIARDAAPGASSWGKKYDRSELASAKRAGARSRAGRAHALGCRGTCLARSGSSHQSRGPAL